MVAEQFIIKEPMVNLGGGCLGIGSLHLLSLFKKIFTIYLFGHVKS